MHKIAVCGNARSGTSSLNRFFVDLGVDSVHEPFHDRKWKGPYDEKAYDIVEEVAKLYDDHHAMKHLWLHVPDQVNRRLIRWLVSHGVKVIHIERTNRLAQAISMKLASETGLWGTNDPEEYLEQCASIRLDVEALKQRMTEIEALECDYKQLLAQGNLLSVKHEQLYSAAPPQVEDTVRKMLQFTALDPEAGQLRLAMGRFHPSRKQTTTSVYALIPNIAEIEAAFGLKLT
ncbi:MAG: hypothetical protein GKR89_03675 [Candidatus Latescibacteria bacterium]|nr:hypothetical protein [Candidatus Latescibacterota bacterium]